VNTILNLPLYLEVKKAPTPTNDVAFTIGQDSLLVNLGAAAQLVPEDQFRHQRLESSVLPRLRVQGFPGWGDGWIHDDVSSAG